MGRYLMLDIGAGTLDILCYDTEDRLHYKAVAPSPVRVLADDIRRTTGNLVITGGEMGGGPVSQALIERAKVAEVVMSTPSAATIHHDLKRVSDLGIRVVAPAEAQALIGNERFEHVITGDLRIDRLRQLLQGLGQDTAFDAVAVCAQDHGVAPQGVSHLDFRHRLFTQALTHQPDPRVLLYEADRIPKAMNRLSTIASDAQGLPADRVYVMDSGMAAIAGASTDALAQQCRQLLVLDVATSHTVGAAMADGMLCGFFEYHTSDITTERLDSLLVDLADGNLSHRQILAEGGHGAYRRNAIGYDRVERIVATGPRRGMVAASRLPMTFGAPWGDNMMTGTVGLLEAVRLREGLPPIDYL